MTEPAPLQQLDRTFVRFRSRKLSYFSGCDYFRLASHPRVMAALQAGLKKYGLNVAASRLTTGNHVLYVELERRLANFFGAENALVVPAGYMTNLVVAQALAGNFSHVLLEERSHPSLNDAARFLDCPVLQFQHRDPDDLARALARCGPHAKAMLLTEGMFSHDGSAAPLADYLTLLPRDAMILVDDAHGAGVLGKSGQGALEYAGVSRGRIIQTVTLSKAFGAYGGAILGTPQLRKRILSHSRLFIASTPLPLPLASAALESVRILKTDRSLRQRLFRNAAYVKTALRESASDCAKSGAQSSSLSSPGPIISALPNRSGDISLLNRALLAAAIYPPLINYPGAPAGGYFRFVISSEHTSAQLDRLLDALCHSRALCQL
jgi:7-keto-8-aminopelargonate synthetase-like enzyme